MDKAAYLRRIGVDDDVAPSAETLRRLHVAHLRTVPFENLDIHRDRPIRLDQAAFFEKIVNERRGGYCYELNGLFGWLLEEIGFTVTLLSAGVYEEEADRFGPDGDHLCLLVEGDQRWLADVGFGASFLEPLPLADGAENVDGSSAYRLEENGDEWTLWSRDAAKDRVPQYRFTLRARRLYDFTYANHYMQTSPESHFTQKQICTRSTPEGRTTISDMRLIKTIHGHRTEVQIGGDAEYAELLKEHFGITLP